MVQGRTKMSGHDHMVVISNFEKRKTFSFFIATTSLKGIEETGISPACALVSNRENKRGVIEALVVCSRSGPRYLSDRAPFFVCL